MPRCPPTHRRSLGLAHGLVATWWASPPRRARESSPPPPRRGGPAGARRGVRDRPRPRSRSCVQGSTSTAPTPPTCWLDAEVAEREGLAPALRAATTSWISRAPIGTIYTCTRQPRQQMPTTIARRSGGSTTTSSPAACSSSTTRCRTPTRRGGRYWTAEGRRALPEQFEEPEWRAGSDGAEYRFRSRTVEVDPLAQRLTMEVQASMRRGDEVLRDETYLLAMTMYTANHIELMLSVAGFEDIETRADWTADGSDSGHGDSGVPRQEAGRARVGSGTGLTARIASATRGAGGVRDGRARA